MFNYNGQYPYGPGGILPIIPVIPDMDHDIGLKMPQDELNVYVNGDFVGKKTLVAQGDGGVNSVKDYLKENGFYDFKYKVIGDNIYIGSAGDNSRDIKNHLRVYLSIR
ncbi:MAG: hypothetical protein QME45_08250 [Clostridiales bacterium]|nr:hypothetical protein [Clostridiales bacterium]HBM81948.1 hypothetical protein [Clostridiaceae bacterium]